MRNLLLATALAGAVGAAATGASAAPVGPAAPPATSAVVVQAASAGAAAQAVARAGGRVTRDLPLVDAVAARVPTRALPALARTAGVRAVTPDERLTVQSTPTTDAGSDLKSVYADEVGATALRAAGRRGAGVRVALVDTGVSPVADLAGRIVPVDDPTQRVALGERREVACVNFSGEADCRDSYGHGTFLAGLIAGDGTSSGGRFTGVAPEAEIVSVKIAGADGSADVSRVLAAIQWVVSFKDTYGIEVLNLSLGTNSTVPVEQDPLNHAVQRAWDAGIVVVVAASNRGPVRGTISKPADDPLVLTVGAVDDRETPALSDDRSPAFSGRGPTAHGRAKPDVVAPGVRLVSLRAPGSMVERTRPGGVDPTYRRGTGTSMSAAVVSGLVALVREAQPTWSPDRVKTVLKATAAKTNSDDPTLVGAGLVQGAAAAVSGVPTLLQGLPTAEGTGSLDGSRADVLVERAGCTQPCDPVKGEQTGQDRAWSPTGYTDTDWTGSSWYSSQWVGLTGSSWYGSSWYGNDSGLYGSSWYGSSWYGVEGDDPAARPFGLPVPGSAWYGVYQ